MEWSFEQEQDRAGKHLHLLIFILNGNTIISSSAKLSNVSNGYMSRNLKLYLIEFSQ